MTMWNCILCHNFTSQMNWICDKTFWERRTHRIWKWLTMILAYTIIEARSSSASATCT